MSLAMQLPVCASQSNMLTAGVCDKIQPPHPTARCWRGNNDVPRQQANRGGKRASQTEPKQILGEKLIQREGA